MQDRNSDDQIRIVGDFICDAVPGEGWPEQAPIGRGKNEGVCVIADFTNAAENNPDGTEP